MSSIVQLSGELRDGPTAVGDPDFPNACGLVQLTFNPAQKRADYSTGFMRRDLTPVSGGGFVMLDGAGTTSGDTMKQGHTLYFRCKVPCELRLTTGGSGGDNVAVIPVKGFIVIEFDPDKCLKLLEVKGTDKVEWLVAGNS